MWWSHWWEVDRKPAKRAKRDRHGKREERTVKGPSLKERRRQMGVKREVGGSETQRERERGRKERERDMRGARERERGREIGWDGGTRRAKTSNKMLKVRNLFNNCKYAFEWCYHLNLYGEVNKFPFHFVWNHFVLFSLTGFHSASNCAELTYSIRVYLVDLYARHWSFFKHSYPSQVWEESLQLWYVNAWNVLKIDWFASITLFPSTFQRFISRFLATHQKRKFQSWIFLLLFLSQQQLF